MSRRSNLLSISSAHRRDWDPTEPVATFTRTEDDIDTVELHHTGGPGPADLRFDTKARWLLSIERYHEESRGWSDIFYHVFVFADGEIWEGRDLRRTSQGDISNALTVHIPGNNPEITEEQYASLLRIARMWADSPAHIRGHNQRPASTQCPGQNGLNAITRLREDFTMIEHIHEYQDLSDMQDAKAAKDNGLWNGSNPTGAASRSTVAVMAQRALDKASGNVAEVPPDALRDAIRREMPAIVAQVLSEMRDRLK